jgi:hypothetical protein
LYRSGSCCVMQHRKHTPKTVNVRLPRYWKQDLIRGTQLCAVYSKFLGIDVWFLSVITVTLYDIVNLRLQPCANAVCSAFHHQQNMRLSQGSELRSGASCIKASAEQRRKRRLIETYTYKQNRSDLTPCSSWCR